MCLSHDSAKVTCQQLQSWNLPEQQPCNDCAGMPLSTVVQMPLYVATSNKHCIKTLRHDA
jgi:hypothetical protein